MNWSVKSKEQEKELRNLYKKFPDIKKFLLSLGCGTDTAEDIFQEALIIYCRKKSNPDFHLHTEPFFYLKSTCKLLWYNESRKTKNTFELPREVSDIQDDWLEKELRLKTLENAINLIGKKCKEILHLFYGKGWSMTDIAYKVGLRNDKVIKAQKYRCIQEAKKLVIQLTPSEDRLTH